MDEEYNTESTDCNDSTAGITHVTFILNIRLFSFARAKVLVVYEFILSSEYHILPALYLCHVGVLDGFPHGKMVQYFEIMVLLHDEGDPTEPQLPVRSNEHLELNTFIAVLNVYAILCLVTVLI